MRTTSAVAPALAVGLATARYLWAQHRLFIAASLGYLAFLVALFQMALAGRPPEEGAGYTIPFLFTAIGWMAVFSYPQADLASPHSGFPRHLLTLPVSTRQLVLWPMLLGGLTLSALWVTMAALVWRAVGVTLPLFWPAAMLAAALASLQAILWSPAGLPFVRVLTSVAVVSAVLAAGPTAAGLGVPEPLIGAAYLALLPAAYALAVAGLARARRGDSPQWHVPVLRALARLRPRWASPPPPFASAREALLWFEWRASGLMLLLVMAGSAAVIGLPAIWMGEDVPLGIGGIRVNAYVKHQWLVLLFPGVFSMVRAGARPDMLLHVRPLSSWQVVSARLRATLRDVVVLVAAAVAILLLWTLAPASEGDARAPLFWLLLPHLRWGHIVTSAIAAALACALLWKLRAQGLFVELAGRRWVTAAYNLAVVAALVGAALVAPFVWGRPEAMRRALDALPHALAVAVALKAVAATMALRALWRRRLLDLERLDVLLACWLAAVAALFAILATAIPAERLSLAAKALLAIHLVPLARLAAAPLALEWNRHR